MKINDTDIFVIGGGPAGSVAAAMVAQSGLTVSVIEKQHFPRFVIGESLLPKCMEDLEEAGFLEDLKTKDFAVKNGAKFTLNGVSCHFDFSESFTEGWSWSWQVSRAQFDKALTDNLEKRGIPVHFGQKVTDFQYDGSNCHLSIEDEAGKIQHVRSKFVIDASGYGRVLPNLMGLDKTIGKESRSAFFAHVKDDILPIDQKEDFITIVIHEQKLWLWIIPFGSGVTSVGFVGDPDFINQFELDDSLSEEDKFTALLNQVTDLDGRFSNPEYVRTPKRINAFGVSSSEIYGPGFAVCGNSSDFIDPIFSSGVTFATASGSLAGKLASRQLKGETIDWENEYSQYLESGINTFRAFVLSWYAGKLPEIFFYSNESNGKLKKQICSILAGYVWDKENPFVRKAARSIRAISNFIERNPN